MRIYRVETTRRPPESHEHGWVPPGEFEQIAESVEGPEAFPWSWPRDRNYFSATAARRRLARIRRWGGDGRILRSAPVGPWETWPT